MFFQKEYFKINSYILLLKDLLSVPDSFVEGHTPAQSWFNLNTTVVYGCERAWNGTNQIFENERRQAYCVKSNMNRIL